MMMAEYIERKAAIREMYKEPSYYDPINILTEVRDRIRAIPAADVRPVVRGEWYMKTMTVPGGHGRTYGKYGCSICMHKVERRSNFCPNCGAKMKGVEDKS